MFKFLYTICLILFVSSVHASPIVIVKNGTVEVYKNDHNYREGKGNLLLKVEYDISKDFHEISQDRYYQAKYKRIDKIYVLGQCLVVWDGGHGAVGHSGFATQVDSWNIENGSKYSLKVEMAAEKHASKNKKWALFTQQSEGTVYSATLLKEDCQLKELALGAFVNSHPIDKDEDHLILYGGKKKYLITNNGDIKIMQE